jgi:ribosomal subunit interface protein
MQEMEIMQVEPQIRFHGMEPSPSVEEVVREKIDHLARFHDRITSCEVVIDAPHRHSQQGKVYRVQIAVTVPGATIVAGKERRSDHSHEDVYVAIRDSFNAAQRQLEDIVRRKSGYRVKPHPETLRGKVARLMADEGYGFIVAPDGREFFFRRESVASEKEWSALADGTEVRFREHEGEKGAHASAVTLA